MAETALRQGFAALLAVVAAAALGQNVGRRRGNSATGSRAIRDGGDSPREETRSMSLDREPSAGAARAAVRRTRPQRPHAPEAPGTTGGAGREIAIASPGHTSTSFDRRGEIVDVLGTHGRRSYRVRWLDGTESVVPAGAARIAGASTRR